MSQCLALWVVGADALCRANNLRHACDAIASLQLHGLAAELFSVAYDQAWSMTGQCSCY